MFSEAYSWTEKAIFERRMKRSRNQFTKSKTFGHHPSSVIIVLICLPISRRESCPTYLERYPITYGILFLSPKFFCSTPKAGLSFFVDSFYQIRHKFSPPKRWDIVNRKVFLLASLTIQPRIVVQTQIERVKKLCLVFLPTTVSKSESCHETLTSEHKSVDE